MSRLRNFCFTLNNYTKEDEEGMLKIPYKYMIYGYEGEEKTSHIQGYCELLKQTSFTVVKKYIPRAHIEPRKGTAEQATEYCKKEKDFHELGEARQQGIRGDLDNIREIAAEQGMREVTAIGSAQQIAVAGKYLTYNEDIRDWKPVVIYIHGKPGSGKSRMAREMSKDMDTYCKMNSSKWWDGYDKHECIIWDDFRDTDIEFNDFLRLIDRYSYMVEVKGGWRQILAKTIIFTAVKPLSRQYLYNNENRDQITRRIDQIIDLSNYSEVGEGNTKTSLDSSCELLWEAQFEEYKTHRDV